MDFGMIAFDCNLADFYKVGNKTSDFCCCYNSCPDIWNFTFMKNPVFFW